MLQTDDACNKGIKLSKKWLNMDNDIAYVA